MGVAFKDIITGKEITIEELKGNVLAVDSYNVLYQFLTTIRARDGTVLMDSKGNVTSHLVGLFNRTTKLMSEGLKLAFVFDGKPPKLKEKERKRRKEAKIEAGKLYEEAKKKEDVEGMKKYAARTSRLDKEMVEEAKKVIEALGLPVVQAPSEGEAQAAHIVREGKAFAVVSQDFDSLIHGASKLVRNLSIAGKRKKASQLAYDIVKPEIIDLAENLNNLAIDREQLIALALLVGTDYNPGGIKGIGPKNALKLVKNYGKDFDKLFLDVKWEEHFDFPWTEAYYLIKNMPVSDDFKLEWKGIDRERLMKILIDKHDFSEERVESSLKNLLKAKEEKKQKGLGEFFN